MGKKQKELQQKNWSLTQKISVNKMKTTIFSPIIIGDKEKKNVNGRKSSPISKIGANKNEKQWFTKLVGVKQQNENRLRAKRERGRKGSPTELV